MWYNDSMLEYPIKQEGNFNKISYADTSASKFFNYTEQHRNDGVEGSSATAELVIETIKDINGVFYKDVGAMYPLVDGRVLVRRENVETVMHALLDGVDISIEPKGLYPNVAWFDKTHGSEGLKNAFLEGRAQLNGVVAVVGFEPGDALFVVDQKDIPDEPGVFLGANGEDLDRRSVASAHGVVPQDGIRFVIFRFPYQYFPENEMTDEEVLGGEKNPNGKLQYIFRGILFPKGSGDTSH